MRYTRRDFGKLALTAMPAVAIARPSLAALAQAPAKPNSTINGVDLGTITYSYRSMPDQSAEAILRYVLDSGISRIEFMGGPVEAFAGAPPSGGFRGGGRGGPPPTPEQQAAQREAAEQAARVANVRVDGSFQGAAEDVQRCRRHDLRVEAAQPEHVRRRNGIRVQRRGSARLHAHDTRADRRTRTAAAHRAIRGEEEDLRGLSHAPSGQHDGVRSGVCGFEGQHGERRSRALRRRGRRPDRIHQEVQRTDLQRAPEGSHDARARARGTCRGARAIRQSRKSC